MGWHAQAKRPRTTLISGASCTFEQRAFSAPFTNNMFERLRNYVFNTFTLGKSKVFSRSINEIRKKKNDTVSHNENQPGL